MTIDEFLIAIGVKADTQALTDTEQGLERVEEQAEQTDQAIEGFSGKLTGFLKNFATFATAAFTAIKGVLIGAWAYFDSTIDKVEELQDAEDETLRTTKEQVEMAKKYRENMEKMGKTIEYIKTKIALGFLPALYEMSKQYSRLIDDNKELISEGITLLLNAVNKASQVIINLIKFIDLVVSKTIGWKATLALLVIGLAIFKRAMIFAFITNPVTWIIAAIAGLVLIIDDLMTYMEGGESLFGEYWGAMFGWVNDNKDAIKSLWDGVVAFATDCISFIVDIGSAFYNLARAVMDVFVIIFAIFSGNTELMEDAWDSMLNNLLSMFLNLANAFTPIADLLRQALAFVFDKIASAFESLGSFMLSSFSDFVDSISSVASGIFDAIVDPFKKAFSWVENKWKALKGTFSSDVNATMSDATSARTSAVNNNRSSISNTSVNASINVNGAGNPQTVANAVSGNINKMTASNTSGAALA